MILYPLTPVTFPPGVPTFSLFYRRFSSVWGFNSFLPSRRKPYNCRLVVSVKSFELLIPFGRLSLNQLRMPIPPHRDIWCPEQNSNLHCNGFGPFVSCQLDYRGIYYGDFLPLHNCLYLHSRHLKEVILCIFVFENKSMSRLTISSAYSSYKRWAEPKHSTCFVRRRITCN